MIMENVCISVVIPVYNAYEYLSKCIDSCLSQTFQAIEIILVNDSSTDERVLPLLKKYEKGNHKIKVVEKDNGGVTSARLRGVEVSRGKYLCFLDCDDYLEIDALGSMYQKICESDAQMVICNYREVYEDSNFVIERISSFITGSQEGILRSLLMTKCNRMIWCRLIEKSVFQKINIPLNISPKEDDMANFQLLYHIYNEQGTVVLLDKIIYNYIQQKNAVSRKMEKNALNSLLFAIKWTENYFCTHFKYEEFVNELAYYNLSNWAWFLSSGGKCHDDDVKDLIYKKYLKNKWARNHLSKAHILLIMKEENALLKVIYNVYAKQLKPTLKRLSPKKYVT